MMRIITDFTNPDNWPHLVSSRGEGKIMLARDWSVEYEHNGKTENLTIPAMTRVYDGPTGIRYWGLFLKSDTVCLSPAWLPHDDLYITQERPREHADLLFFALLKVLLGENSRRAKIMYKAVSFMGRWWNG